MNTTITAIDDKTKSRRGKWMPHRVPQTKQRAALLRNLKEIFRRYKSQKTRALIKKINPILRGWVNYFAAGHSSKYVPIIGVG